MSKPFYTIDEFISQLEEIGIEASVSKVIDWCKEEKLFISVPIDFLEFANQERIGIYHIERSYVVNEPGEPFYPTSVSNPDKEFPLFFNDIKSKLIEPPFPELEKNNFDIKYFVYVPFFHLRSYDNSNPETYWTWANSFSLLPTPLSKRKEIDKKLLYCLSPDVHGLNYWQTEFSLHSERLPEPVCSSTIGLKLQLFFTCEQARKFVEQNKKIEKKNTKIPTDERRAECFYNWMEEEGRDINSVFKESQTELWTRLSEKDSDLFPEDMAVSRSSTSRFFGIVGAKFRNN